MADLPRILEPVAKDPAVVALLKRGRLNEPVLATCKTGKAGQLAAFLIVPAGDGAVVRAAWPMSKSDAAAWLDALNLDAEKHPNPYVRAYAAAYKALCAAIPNAPDKYPSRHGAVRMFFAKGAW